jgi:hypothetical protein
MVYFHTKNPNLGNFWGSWNGTLWSVLWPLGIFYGHLVYFIAIWYSLWYIIPVLVLDQEKSGNPGFNETFQSIRPSLWNPCTQKSIEIRRQPLATIEIGVVPLILILYKHILNRFSHFDQVYGFQNVFRRIKTTCALTILFHKWQ